MKSVIPTNEGSRKPVSRPRDEQDDKIEDTEEETYRPVQEKEGSAGENENRGNVPSSREWSRGHKYGGGAQWR